MTSRRERFLAGRTSCSACGARRIAELDRPGVAHFACGLAIELNSESGEFAAIWKCGRRTEQLVRHWNQQTKGGGEKPADTTVDQGTEGRS